MRIKGEVRGMSFKSDATYITAKKGEASLKKVEKELEKVGCPIKYKKMRALGYYPVGWRPISLLAVKKAFGWEDKELRELGAFVASDSLIVRIYSRFFHSIGSLAKKAPQIFKEYFTRGELVISDYSEEKKYAVVEIKDLDLHPVFCRLVEGYLAAVVKMVVGVKEMECRETKCTFKGQDRHQFKVTLK